MEHIWVPYIAIYRSVLVLLGTDYIVIYGVIYAATLRFLHMGADSLGGFLGAWVLGHVSTAGFLLECLPLPEQITLGGCWVPYIYAMPALGLALDKLAYIPLYRSGFLYT